MAQLKTHGRTAAGDHYLTWDFPDDFMNEEIKPVFPLIFVSMIKSLEMGIEQNYPGFLNSFSVLKDGNE